MDKQSEKARKCSEKKAEARGTGSKRICIPLGREEHEQIIEKGPEYRAMLEKQIEQYPELFPQGIVKGYHLHGMHPPSKKMPEVKLRRIKLKEKDETSQAQVFTIAPCIVSRLSHKNFKVYITR